MPEKTRIRLAASTTPRASAYSPHEPTPKQAAFLLLDHVREVFYGGAAAGGKSDALLMAALQFVDVPEYAALLLRRNFKQLSMPGALMARAHQWLDPTDARWSAGQKTWTFPSGATLTFGHFGTNEEALRQYESAEFQFIGVDELTGFAESDYRFMFSRLRRLAHADVPIRMRSASNPIGRGREWVKKRFVDPATRITRARFVPAFLWDNPHVDQAEYIETLRELHPVTWRRLLRGDWDATDPGEMFQPRIWLEDDDYLDEAPTSGVRARVRYWDLASSEATSERMDPDWTAGARFSRLDSGIVVIEHVLRRRATPGGVEKIIAGTATSDPPGTVCWMEQDPGQAGKSQVDHYRRNVIPDGVMFKGQPPQGNKAVRALPLAAAMEKHRVKVVRGDWNDPLFDEMEAFSEENHGGKGHDDQVDACSGANAKVRGGSSTGTSSSAMAGMTVRR